jgi:hypothetical protein
MSGSPVFTGSGELVGVIRGASSTTQMLWSSLIGGSFQAEVMRAMEPIAWSLLSPKDRFLEEIRKATQFHRFLLEESASHNRLWLSLKFQDMVKNITVRAAREFDTRLYASKMVDLFDYPDTKGHNIIHQTSRDPQSTPPPYTELSSSALKINESDIDFLIRDLILRTQLESNGLNSGWFKPLTDWQINQIIGVSQSGEVDADRKALFDSFKENGFHGSSLMLLTTSIFFGSIFLALISIWALSLGYVFGRLHYNSFGRRLLITLFVALGGWPISFGVFLFKNRRG